ncbi:hypothetical protein FO519_009444 [Halicephalobus sp. NKZ332]|nr:hypothetical protein FO519_009444 [Halicephalobus sp. NKZ332]
MDSSADFGCLRRINEIEIVSKNHVRAHPRHICGFFMSTRVFGGQTVGQGYYAFKKLYPESTVVKIDTNFIAPGNGNEIIDFFIDLNSLKFGFTKVEVKQKEKIIAYYVKITDPLLIPLIMTDYFIFHPALSIYVLYERTMEAVNGASLNHTVNVHCDSPDIDPHGFFLIQTKCNTISRQSSIIDGRIFDEKKRLILTYRQQNYTAP